MQKPNYRINPSLLNSYWNLVNYDTIWDTFYGQSEEPAVTLEEFYRKQEQELLDSINRIDRGPIEAASKGTALNEIVDCIIEHRKSGSVGIRSVRDPEGRPQHIIADIDGFTFLFDAGLCMELASYFRGSVCQHLCEATMQTAFGPVILYGYSDYVRKDVVYDLKTTSSYSYGKYADGFQKDLYPWCLIESGELETVSGFEYTAVKLTGGSAKNPIISGDVSREWYDYDHRLAGERLRDFCESFINWVELHRAQITHTRIFNK